MLRRHPCYRPRQGGQCPRDSRRGSSLPVGEHTTCKRRCHCARQDSGDVTPWDFPRLIACRAANLLTKMLAEPQTMTQYSSRGASMVRMAEDRQCASSHALALFTLTRETANWTTTSRGTSTWARIEAPRQYSCQPTPSMSPVPRTHTEKATQMRPTHSFASSHQFNVPDDSLREPRRWRNSVRRPMATKLSDQETCWAAAPI